MRMQSGSDISQLWFKADFRVPKSFSDDAGTLDHFLVEGVLVAQLVPHARSTSDHVDSRNIGIERVSESPMLVFEVIVAFKTTESQVQIGEIVIG